LGNSNPLAAGAFIICGKSKGSSEGLWSTKRRRGGKDEIFGRVHVREVGVEKGKIRGGGSVWEPHEKTEKRGNNVLGRISQN